MFTATDFKNLFHSVKEHPEPYVAMASGDSDLPEWLIGGKLMRSGPGKWDLDKDFALNHFLDGCAILAKLEFVAKDKLEYSSKYLESNSYKKMMENKRPVYTEFGTKAFPDQAKSTLGRLFNKFIPSDLTDNNLSNIYQFCNDCYVTTESCNMWKIDVNNLASLERISLEKSPGVTISSSHPLESDGYLYNFGSTFATGLKYHLYRVKRNDEEQSADPKKESPFAKAEVICTIPSSYKSYLSYNHSFAMTEKYVIMIEQPMLIDALKLAACTFKGWSMDQCLEWLGDEPTRFHVIEKKTGKLLKTKYQTHPLFFFHVINAFDTENTVVIDLTMYEDTFVFEKLSLKNLRAGEWEASSTPTPVRFVLPINEHGTFPKDVPNILDSFVADNDCVNNLVNGSGGSEANGHDDGELAQGKAAKMMRSTFGDAVATLLGPNKIMLEYSELSMGGFENATINPKLRGLKYNYMYGSGHFERGMFSNACCKVDIGNKDVAVYRPIGSAFPGEAVFVPAPDAKSEDDGVVLILVLESNPERDNFLAVLDAKTFKEIARFDLPKKDVDVPTTIHGIFIHK